MYNLARYVLDINGTKIIVIDCHEIRSIRS